MIDSQSLEGQLLGRRHWYLWIVAGMVAGAVAGNYVESVGLLRGMVAGGLVEVLTVLLVNGVTAARKGGILVALLVLIFGLVVGAACGSLAGGQVAADALAGAQLGLGIALLDRVFVWVFFPYGEGHVAPSSEPEIVEPEAVEDE